MQFEELKAKIDLRTVFEGRAKDGKITCPNHTESTPSCHVYEKKLYCYGCGWRGDYFDYLQVIGRAKDAKEAFEIAKQEFSAGGFSIPKKRKADKKEEQKVFCPFPKDVLSDPNNVEQFAKFWKDKKDKWQKALPIARYVYATKEGRGATVVCRYDKNDIEKRSAKVLPKSWNEKEKKVQSGIFWLSESEKLGGHPLYNLPKIIKNSTAPIVFVEGEKCVVFLQNALEEKNLNDAIIVTTNIGGCNALGNSDLVPLHKRKVFTWADNDPSGEALMLNVKGAVIAGGGNVVQIDPVNTKKGADCADLTPENAVNIILEAIKNDQNQSQNIAQQQDNIEQHSEHAFVDFDPMSLPVPPKSAHDKPKSCSSNLRYIIEIEHKVGNLRIRWNQLRRQFELLSANNIMAGTIENFDGKIEDSRFNLIKIYLETSYGFPIDEIHLRSAISTLMISKNHVYHPVRDYLNGLQWDGVGRLNQWFVDVYNPDSGEEEEWARIATSKFLIASVARIMSDQEVYVDNMLVLESKEGGIGKSKGIDTLFGGFSIHMKNSIKHDDKDASLEMAKNWAVIDDEMKITLSIAGQQMREFITRTKEEIREPYAKNSSRITRNYVLLGTVNPPEGDRYLSPDENLRRLWIVQANKHSDSGEETVEYIKRNRDQIWAEAFHYWQQGHSWWLKTDSEEEALQLRITNKRRQRNDLEDEVLEYLNDRNNAFVDSFKVSTFPYKVLDVIGSKASVTQKQREAINKVMYSLGWKQKSISNSGQKARHWCRENEE